MKSSFDETGTLVYANQQIFYFEDCLKTWKIHIYFQLIYENIYIDAKKMPSQCRLVDHQKPSDLISTWNCVRVRQSEILLATNIMGVIQLPIQTISTFQLSRRTYKKKKEGNRKHYKNTEKGETENI